jgi:hypothetical protein
MPRRKLTPKQKLEKELADDRYREWQIERGRKLKSPCLEGRTKHFFRSPKTRSLTPDLKCKKCGKTVAQVRVEQRAARMID